MGPNPLFLIRMQLIVVALVGLAASSTSLAQEAAEGWTEFELDAGPQEASGAWWSTPSKAPLFPVLRTSTPLGLAVPSPADPDALWAQTTLYRDEWGVPHVFADSVRAMAFAFGYAQADDHIEAMLTAYRVATGRAAEVFGEAFAPSDEHALMLAHDLLAARALPHADPVTQQLCEGFALGVNYWLARNMDQAPPWAEGINPADVLALWHYLLMSQAPFDLPGAYRPAPFLLSGNAWAIGPTKTESGAPILAVNPHGSFTGPFRWYEAHLATPDFNMTGATVYGLPILLMGHNDVLGWGLTPHEADTADVYMERLARPQHNPRALGEAVVPVEELFVQYLARSSRPYAVRTAAGMDRRFVPTLLTARGPLVGKHNGQYCTWRAGGYGAFGGLRQLFEMARARNLAEFQGALALRQLPTFHVVYADAYGDIFHLYNVVAGDKFTQAPPPPGSGASVVTADWTTPVPSANPAFAWGQLVPLGVLPAVLNPPADFVQACATPPWGVTSGMRMGPGDFPAWFAPGRDSFRAKRVRQLLSFGPRTFADAQDMVYDVVVPAAVEAVPHLLKAAQSMPHLVSAGHPDLVPALELFRRWNFVAEPHSPGMTLFHLWWQNLAARTGAGYGTRDRLIEALGQGDGAAAQIAIGAASDAARLLRNQYGRIDVRWGTVHPVQRGARTEPLGGSISGEPIFLSSDSEYADGIWPARYGFGYAMVVQFGRMPQSVSMVPFGASDRPNSPHYADQLDLMLERRLKRVHFRPDDVIAHSERALGRIINLRPVGMDALFTFFGNQLFEARLLTMADAPAPLPDGLAPYSLYVRAEHTLDQAALRIAIHVPEEVIDDTYLDELAIYAYDEAAWHRLPAQEPRAARSRTLAAQDTGQRIYAVLGPEALRLGAGSLEPVVPGKPLDTEPTEGALAERELVWSDGPIERPETPPAPDGQPAAPDTPAPDGEPLHVADAASPAETTEAATGPDGAPIDPRLLMAHASKGIPGADQAVDDVVDAEGNPWQFYDGRRVRSRSNAPAEGDDTAPIEVDGANPWRFDTADVRRIAAVPKEPMGRIPGTEPASVPTEEAAPLPAPPPPGGALERMTGRDLAPGEAATPTQRGTRLEFAPPGVDAVLWVASPRSIRGRAIVTDAPPGALPPGLRNRTKFVEVQVRPSDAPIEVTWHLTVEPPPGGGEPALYAWSQRGGWEQLEGQRYDATTKTLTGFDLSARVYAVLGPGG